MTLISDYLNFDNYLEFWLSQLHFDVIIIDYFGSLIGPVNGCITFTSDNDNTYYCYFIDSTHYNTTLTSNDVLFY